ASGPRYFGGQQRVSTRLNSSATKVAHGCQRVNAFTMLPPSKSSPAYSSNVIPASGTNNCLATCSAFGYLTEMLTTANISSISLMSQNCSPPEIGGTNE